MIGKGRASLIAVLYLFLSYLFQLHHPRAESHEFQKIPLRTTEGFCCCQSPQPAAIPHPGGGCHLPFLGQHLLRAVRGSGERPVPGLWPGRALPGAPAQPLRGAAPAGVSAALHGMPQAVLLLRD